MAQSKSSRAIWFAFLIIGVTNINGLKVVTVCDDPVKNICSSNGICIANFNTVSCICKYGFIGDGITCVPNPCTDPVLNNCDDNAKCTPGLDEAVNCTCKTGYEGNGTSCEEVDYCADPVLNNCDVNAECANKNGGVSCTCLPGYQGNGTDCKMAPCNEGVAIPWNGGFQCLCPPNKKGLNCSEDVPDSNTNCSWPSNEDACSSSPCHGKKAVCINTFGGNFKCLCEPGKEGDRCDQGSHCFPCFSVRWRNVTCSVYDDAQFMRSMRLKATVVDRQMSRTKCTEDKWGFDQNTGDMWVARGCRARFCVDFEAKPMMR